MAEFSSERVLKLSKHRKVSARAPYVKTGMAGAAMVGTGFLMAATALLADNPNPSEAQVREALDGNLCRCTGYDGIVTSILAAAETLRGH